jgi:hypothetical protein
LRYLDMGNIETLTSDTSAKIQDIQNLFEKLKELRDRA